MPHNKSDQARIASEFHAKVVEINNKQLAATLVGAANGVSAQRVTQIVRESGGPKLVSPTHSNYKQVIEVLQLRATGLNQREISRRTGVKPPTVYYYCRVYKLAENAESDISTHGEVAEHVTDT